MVFTSPLCLYLNSDFYTTIDTICVTPVSSTSTSATLHTCWNSINTSATLHMTQYNTHAEIAQVPMSL